MVVDHEKIKREQEERLAQEKVECEAVEGQNYLKD